VEILLLKKKTKPPSTIPSNDSLGVNIINGEINWMKLMGKFNELGELLPANKFNESKICFIKLIKNMYCSWNV
jgi:hypothetical protein